MKFLIALALMGSPGTENPLGTPPSLEVPAGTEYMVTEQGGSENLELGEVQLGASSTLELPPFKSVKIQKLIAADGARIRLSHQGSGGDGASSAGDGANARIFIGEVGGHVLIEARGGDGANGVNGRDGRQGADGAAGRRARTLFFGLIYLGDGEDGKPGQAGENGENGGDGANGGNGGKVTVYYQNKINFAEIVLNVDGGVGGKAGQPGAGGMGGNGGLGGRGIQKGNQGAMGAAGVAGLPGRTGQPGNPGEAFIYQLESELFTCLVQLDARLQASDLLDEDYLECRNLKTGTADPEGDIVRVFSSSQHEVLLNDPLEGTLHLNADGANGENAIAARIPGTTPNNGSTGAKGGHLTVVLKEVPKKVFISAKGGSGGDGADGANGKKGIDGYDGRNANAFRKGKPGTDGSDGTAAGNGSTGGDGGKGGSVRVIYLLSNTDRAPENWRGSFQINVEGGAAGKAGDAGAGGHGGKGGKGGRTMIKGKSYPNGRDGVAGADGISGKAGLQGEAGNIEFLEADSFSSWIVDEFKEQSERFFRPTEMN